MLLLDIKHHYKNYLLMSSRSEQVEAILFFHELAWANLFTLRNQMLENIHDLELIKIDISKIKVIYAGLKNNIVLAWLIILNHAGYLLGITWWSRLIWRCNKILENSVSLFRIYIPTLELKSVIESEPAPFCHE